MRGLYYLFKGYLKDHVNPLYLIAVMLFLSLLTAWFYLDKSVMQLAGGGASDNSRLLTNMLLYGGVFLVTLLIGIPFSKDRSWIRNKEFWIALMFAAAVYSFARFFYWHKDLVKELTDGGMEIFWLRVSKYPALFVLIMLPCWLWWKWRKDSKEFYGFKKTDLKPYWGLLALMIPLIIGASFTDGFLKQYPQASKTLNLAHFEESRTLYGLLFEMMYGLNYVITEFFFRGFLIIVLGRYLGPQVVIPVAAWYVAIHYGKPLGETISSFFGGMILGAIAYETRSIYGGILIHLGIAWGMEFAAAIVKGHF